jgi:hypothetical protein
VAADPDRRAALADAIATDPAWAARLSTAGRVAAGRLDAAGVARALYDALGLTGRGGVRRRLAELGSDASLGAHRRALALQAELDRGRRYAA